MCLFVCRSKHEASMKSGEALKRKATNTGGKQFPTPLLQVGLLNKKREQKKARSRLPDTVLNMEEECARKDKKFTEGSNANCTLSLADMTTRTSENATEQTKKKDAANTKKKCNQ